ncbi:MAG: class I SAM-dependent methyltransferase [Tunicatimonas sp.]
MSFDWIAPYYDWLTRLVFGRSIRRAQRHFLGQIPPGARVLVVGGGTGWLLVDLLKRPAVTHVTYLEASAVMLRLAQQKVQCLPTPPSATVHWVHGNERSLPPSGRYDVLITNFVLDMYTGAALDLLMQRLLGHLHPTGYWLFTDFELSKRKQHRGWQRVMTGGMYAFFRVTAGIARQPLPPYHRHFTALGLHRVKEKRFYGDFIVSRVYRQGGSGNSPII